MFSFDTGGRWCGYLFPWYSFIENHFFTLKISLKNEYKWSIMSAIDIYRLNKKTRYFGTIARYFTHYTCTIETHIKTYFFELCGMSHSWKINCNMSILKVTLNKALQCIKIFFWCSLTTCLVFIYEPDLIQIPIKICKGKEIRNIYTINTSIL